jgi:hypothetical protein
MSFMLMVTGALWSHPADAFCGAYVGAEGTEITNRASRIVIARSGLYTALTMFNDFEGDADEFGLIVPLPGSIDEDNLRLVDRTLLDRIDRHSAPRLVSYTCEDFFNDDGTTIQPMVISPTTSSTAASSRSVATDAVGDTGDTGPSSASSSSSRPAPAPSIGCGGGGYSSELSEVDSTNDYYDTATGVTVEEEFDFGEYEIFVLRASDSAGLTAWLADSGFVLPDGASILLEDYVRQDARFLAARVSTGLIDSGQTWLSPLQVVYEADSLSLPIRLGTLSSGGLQDLIVYTLTSPADGRVGISNYPETAAPGDECMLDLDPDDPVGSFSDRYEELWTGATGVSDGQPGLGWTTEYSWGTGTGVKCDPCPDDGPLTNDELVELGYPWADSTGWHLTRLRLRYTPESVDEDLMLYPTRIEDEQEQVRYIVRQWELESLLPVCGEQPAEPGSCYTGEYWARVATGETELTSTNTIDLKRCGCRESRGLLLLPLLLLSATRRRR